MSRRRNPDLSASLHPALRAADGAPYFSDEALEEANREGETYKSRTALVLMDPADFLRMADPGKEEARQVALERVLRAGTRLIDVPRLFVDYDKESGIANVTGHEGRHRSRSLLARGVTQMPVRIHTTNIRWGEQASPRSWDYIEVLPHTLTGEGGHARNRMPMPVPIHYPELAGRMRKKNPRRMDGSTYPTRATQVNAYLAEHGFPGVMLHRDARAAYCHFYGGDADYWDETGVYVPRISDLTLDGWLEEAQSLAQTKRNPRPAMRRNALAVQLREGHPSLRRTAAFVQEWNDRDMDRVFADMGARVDVSVGSGGAHDAVSLDSLEATTYRKGAGSRALRALLDLTDKHGLTVTLTAEPFSVRAFPDPDLISRDDLVRFYKRFGFDFDADEDEDEDEDDGFYPMVRYPRAPNPRRR